MISVGLLPIICDSKLFDKQPASLFAKKCTARQPADLHEVKHLSSKLPTPLKGMLDIKRSAFEADSPPPVDHVQAAKEESTDNMCVDPAETLPEAQWQHVAQPSARGFCR